MKKNRGITLIALIVTIIILLILAGISIASLTNSGLFEKTQQAKQEQEKAVIKEEGILADYENKINQYVNSSREQIMVDKEQYDQLLKDVQDLKQSNNADFYDVGDVINYPKRMDLTGYVTGDKTYLSFSISLSKNISSNVKEIEFSTTGFNIRHVMGGYLINSAYSDSNNGLNLSDYFDIEYFGENYITFGYTSNNVFNTTNNSPISIDLRDLVITFK